MSPAVRHSVTEPETKYFVAHLLSGDAHEYHVRLTRELAHRFHITPLHERVDPHITIKNFSATDARIREVEEVLACFAHHTEPVSFSFTRFGRFGHKTVYLDIERNHRITDIARSCIRTLNTLKWMPPSRHEGEKLHASVARFLNPRQFRRVWRRVKEETPGLTDTMNALAILRKDPGARWKTHALFPLGAAASHDMVMFQFLPETRTQFL